MFDKRENTYINSWAKKIKAINILGGKCSMCNRDDPWLLCFHHLRDKKFKEYKTLSWETIKSEIEKCMLVCHNCHRKIHWKPTKRSAKLKQALFRIKGIFKCQECGCSDFATLDFHHDKNQKVEIRIGDIVGRKVNVSFEKIVLEIEKCKVLCHNCHISAHFNKNKFLSLIEKINNQSENLREYKKHDHKLIMDYRKQGYGYGKIAKFLGTTKSVIYYAASKHEKQGEC